jgi:hypothetical protein
LAIPDHLDSVELFFQMEHSSSALLGRQIRLTKKLRSQAMTRWYNGESVGEWSAWLAKQIRQ